MQANSKKGDEKALSACAPEQQQAISREQMRSILVQASWMTLFLAPLLYWLHGPPVSLDQWIVRTLLVAIAAAGAIYSLVNHWRRKNM